MYDPDCKKCHGKGSFPIPCPDNREGCCVLHTQVCDCELRVEAKKGFTIEDVRRLVPEARFYIDDEGDITAEADGYWFKLGEDSTLDLLISTRRKLEIATEALDRLRDGKYAVNWSSYDVAAEALSAIKEES